MAWIDHEHECEPRERGLSTGDVIYWLATIIAALMFVFVLADFFFSRAEGRPILQVFALLTALLFWLIGRVCRAMSS